MRVIQWLFIIGVVGLISVIILGLIFGPPMIDSLRDRLSGIIPPKFFELANGELSTGNNYIVSISDSISVEEFGSVSIEEKPIPLQKYETYMSTEHQVNIADALETRNSFAGEIGE